MFCDCISPVVYQANEQGTMNPINILKYGAEEEKSESARMVSNFCICFRLLSTNLKFPKGSNWNYYGDHFFSICLLSYFMFES